jgi:hypothetical protein
MKKFIIIIPIIVVSSLFGCVNAQETKKDENNANQFQKVKGIDEVYISLLKSKGLTNKKIQCELLLFETNRSVNKYVVKIKTKEVFQSINYISEEDDKADLFVFGIQKFQLQNKVDPLSLSTYLIFSNGKSYLCFIGKGQSASGSGLQVTYFNVFELDRSGKAVVHYEFNSRFGNIHSIIDYNNIISYYKVVNGNKIGQYMLTINDIKSGKRINNRLVLLDYKLNDRFVVLKDTSI